MVQRELPSNRDRQSHQLTKIAQELFSYNVEQSRGDTHNMICVFMINDGLSLQQAVDRIGEMCKRTIDTFVENQARVPSWGDRIDRDVELYVNGLQEWIVGSLHWSFMTTIYFGDNGGAVRATRIVELLPRRARRVEVWDLYYYYVVGATVVVGYISHILQEIVLMYRNVYSLQYF